MPITFLRSLIIFWFFGLVFLSGCAANYPVQEMSNARQTLQAAEAVNAQLYASAQYQEAQRLLDLATAKLDEGDYILARKYALSAKQLAIKARMEAISQQQTENKN
jgi:hypothetical protein